MIRGLVNRVRLWLSPRVSYEDARDLAADQDVQIRAQLAARKDVKPEILYFLARDEDGTVRRTVAANSQTPPQADLILANDADKDVRAQLAQKLAGLLPGLPPDHHDRLGDLTLEALEILARDQVVQVRATLAEAIKSLPNAPPSLIRRLARDLDTSVAIPILQFSPVLTEEDLLDLIAAAANPGQTVPDALSAISKRPSVAPRVADAIAASDDSAAIAELLANPSAQIREETLDHLVERAPDHPSWHHPLVHRSGLPPHLPRKLARFVAAHLLEALAQRQDLDAPTTQALRDILGKRLAESAPPRSDIRVPSQAQQNELALQRALTLHRDGALDESTLDTALTGGDFAFVQAALAVKSGFTPAVVERAVRTQSAKGIVALAWKAHLSLDLCVRLQSRLALLPPDRILHPIDGCFPLSARDMEWQLSFLDGN